MAVSKEAEEVIVDKEEVIEESKAEEVMSGEVIRVHAAQQYR